MRIQLQLVEMDFVSVLLANNLMAVEKVLYHLILKDHIIQLFNGI